MLSVTVAPAMLHRRYEHSPDQLMLLPYRATYAWAHVADDQPVDLFVLLHCVLDRAERLLLTGDRTLSQARLLDADLSGAHLRSETMDVALLTDVNLWQADLSGADLSGPRWSCQKWSRRVP